jgi:hypothetical protein
VLPNHGDPHFGPLKKGDEGPGQGERELLLLALALSWDPVRLPWLVTSIVHQQAHRVEEDLTARANPGLLTRRVPDVLDP